MLISKLTVKNFRNLADIEIPLGRETVIVGENGSGKSNLIHALRLVLDPTLAPGRRTLSREDFWDGLRPEDEEEAADWDPFVRGEVIEIGVDIEEIEDEPEVLAALGAAVVERDPLTARMIYRFAPREDIEQPEEGAKVYDWGIYGADGQERVRSDLRRYLAHVYLGALRDVEADLRGWRRSPLRALIEEMAEEVGSKELAQIGAAMKSTNAEVTELDAVRDLDEKIESEIKSFIGEQQQLGTAFGLTALEPLRILRGLRLYVDGEARRPLSAASLGSLSVLYVALLELRMRRQLQRGEIAHSVLNIEEPESHLHPHTQRLMFSDLLGEDHGCTTIITTHSPYVVSVMPPRQLVLLRNGGTKTQANAAVDAALTAAEWDDVGRHLDATRGEMVFARKVFLVEGFAEQVMMPLFAAAAGHNLDELGISVCAIHGVHFDIYAKLLDALGTPWAVITDGDRKKGDPEVSFGQKRAKRICSAVGADDADPAAAGIFVGEVTMEQDLYESSEEAASACRAALSSLRRNSVDENLGGAEFLMKLGRRRDRFAQRLAAGQTSLDPPSYIADAIKYLIEQ